MTKNIFLRFPLVKQAKTFTSSSRATITNYCSKNYSLAWISIMMLLSLVSTCMAQDMLTIQIPDENLITVDLVDSDDNEITWPASTSYADGTKNLESFVLLTKNQIIYGSTKDNYKHENITLLKEAKGLFCEEESDRCIIFGHGGVLAYKIGPNKFEPLGEEHYWVSNYSNHFGDPLQLVMSNDALIIPRTDYFLVSESTRTGILRWAFTSNVSYSLATYPTPDERLTSLSGIFHIPRSPFFVNSFVRYPSIGITDFTNMQYLGNWSKPFSSQTSFSFDYVDKVPEDNLILAGRYAEVQLHNLADMEYTGRVIKVRSPTIKVKIIPESFYFFAITGQEANVYDIYESYSSVGMMASLSSSTSGYHGSGFFYWDDLQGMLVSAFSLSLKKFEFVEKEQISLKHCHHSCEEDSCNAGLGRSRCTVCTTEVPSLMINIFPEGDEESGVLAPDPLNQASYVFETPFTLDELSTGSLGVKVKGCYLTSKTYTQNYDLDPFVLESLPFELAENLEFAVNESTPEVKPVPSNETVYTNVTIPTRENSQTLQSGKYTKIIVILAIVVLGMVALLVWLICYVCVEKKGDIEARKKLNFWKLKGWIKRLNILSGEKKSKDSVKSIMGGPKTKPKKLNFDEEIKKKVHVPSEINVDDQKLKQYKHDDFRFAGPTLTLKKHKSTHFATPGKEKKVRGREKSVGFKEHLEKALDEEDFALGELTLKRHMSHGVKGNEVDMNDSNADLLFAQPGNSRFKEDDGKEKSENRKRSSLLEDESFDYGNDKRRQELMKRVKRNEKQKKRKKRRRKLMNNIAEGYV
jgi:hypothetical protein